MKHLSIVMPYYRNPSMLAHHYKIWGNLSPELKEFIDVVIVDDGSPEECAVDVPRPDDLPKVSIYKVLEDRLWHQHGARNLGAKVAEGPWLLLTDMDHVLPSDSLKSLRRVKTKGKAFTLDRVDAPSMSRTRDTHGREKPHPNTFVMTKEVYWRVGGYDEDYCGIYGTDGMFRARLLKRGPLSHLTGVLIVRYSRSVIHDASTRDVPRKEGREHNAKRVRTSEKVAAGRGDVITTLNFPWVREL